MKLTHIAAAVAVALLSSNAALAAEGESAVTSAVKSVVKTVSEADAQSKQTAKSKQECLDAIEYAVLRPYVVTATCEKRDG